MQSSQARTAKEIRELLKSLNIPASVTSKGYSMGDHVNVDLENQPPAIVEQIRKLTYKYQYGHFDGMIDMYEMSNCRDDIPQTKYLMIQNSWTDDIKQKAWEYVINHYAGFEDAPKLYKDSYQFYNKDMQAYGTQFVNRVLSNYSAQNDTELWHYVGIKNETIPTA